MSGPEHRSSLPVEARAYTEAQFRRVYPIGRTKFWAEIGAGRLVGNKCGRVMVFREDADAWARANSAIPPDNSRRHCERMKGTERWLI